MTSTMRRAAHPSGCARCGAGTGQSAIKYQYQGGEYLFPGLEDLEGGHGLDLVALRDRPKLHQGVDKLDNRVLLV